ncbi:MAG: M20/M25/M40 family metallo-hydrolase [Gemmatimonadaceae bacterium]
MASQTVTGLMTVLTAAMLSSATSAVQLGAQGGENRMDMDALREETVRVMSQYLRINTSSPPGNELAAAKFLQEFLRREGIDGDVLDTAELGPGRANFYARLRGTGARKAIALVHHMDVVPALPEQWSVDPFSGAIKEGYVWGRGALDMKGQGVIHLMAMVALKRSGMPLTRDIVFIANADEEVEGKGAATFVQKHADLLKDVEYLLTEGGNSYVERGRVHFFGLGVAEKRAYWLRLVVNGTPSHGSMPTRNNPVARLARAIDRISSWETPLRVLPAVDKFFKAQAVMEKGERREWLANVPKALRNERGRKWILSDPYRNAVLRNTVTPTVVTGSSTTNIIPAQASAEIDIRLLPDEDTATFKRALKRVIADTGVKVETMPGVASLYNAPLETEMVSVIERVVAELLPGVPIATPMETGASDRPTYSQAGIIAYGLGPFLVDVEEDRRGVHGIDERVSIDNIGFGLSLFVRVLQAIQ